MRYDFDERLQFSRGAREKADIDTLMQMIDGCVSVVKTNEAEDRAGTDYVARLRSGATLTIDAKARQKGASKWWTRGAEVALEHWSVVDVKRGWTLCEKRNTDLILFTFDPSDSPDCWLVSYPILRLTFSRNLNDWLKQYKIGKQDSGGWQSQCVFVPVRDLWLAMIKVSHGRLCVPQAVTA